MQQQWSPYTLPVRLCLLFSCLAKRKLTPNQSITIVQELEDFLFSIDGRQYPFYKDIKGSYAFPFFDLHVDYVQGDPFAAPSKIRVLLLWCLLSLPCWRTPSLLIALSPPSAGSAVSRPCFLASHPALSVQQPRPSRRYAGESECVCASLPVLLCLPFAIPPWKSNWCGALEEKNKKKSQKGRSLSGVVRIFCVEL